MSAKNVIVVGGGPTGFLSALALARQGIEVTLLEAEAHIINSPRAMVYHWAVLDILDSLGVLEDADRIGFRNSTLQIRYFETHESVNLSLDSVKGLTPFPYNLHMGQNLVAEVALEHLGRHPHASVRFNTRVTGIQQDANGVTVLAQTPDGPVELKAGWVIGADGGRGTVRDAVGETLEGITWPERFVATNIRFDFAAHGYAYATMMTDAVYGAIVAKIDKTDLWRYTYMESDDLPEDGVLERMKAHFKVSLPGDQRYELVQYSPYRMHQRCVGSMRHGRVLLAGDAAHVTNPSGGLGLTSGLYDLDTLVPALAAVIRGEEDQSLLDVWAKERRDVFLEKASPMATMYKRSVFHPEPGTREAVLKHMHGVSQSQSALREIFSPAMLLRTPALLDRKP